MTTDTKPVTLETLYAEILELKTLLAGRPAAAPSKPARAKKAVDAEPKAPSTNPWILFTKRVDALLKQKYETDAVDKEHRLKAAAAKQFASDLKGRKPYAEWADDEIVAALEGWAPPAVSKQTAEGKSKPKKEKAEAGSDDEAASAQAEKPKRKWSEEAKAAAAAKRATKKAAAPAEEKPAEEKPKKAAAAPTAKGVDLRFYSWTHTGTEYFTNERGDVVTTEFEWVGRFDGTKLDESVPEPADMAQAEMRE